MRIGNQILDNDQKPDDRKILRVYHGPLPGQKIVIRMLMRYLTFMYYLQQGGYVFAFVSLSVNRITQKVVDEL